MPLGIDPITNPQAYDYAQIGGVTTPLCRVTGWKREHKWDEKNGKGARGTTLTMVQRPAAKGTFTFLLVAPADFALWYQLIPALKYDPTKKTPTPVDVSHPFLADLDISSIATEFIGQIEHKGEGLYEVEIQCIEYAPPPNASAVGTPAGATAGIGGQTSNGTVGGGGQPPDANAAQMAQIQALLNQAGAP